MATRRPKVSMPAPQDAEDGLRQLTAAPFDPSKPLGEYEIDKFAKLVPWRADWVELVPAEHGGFDYQFIRQLVARIGENSRKFAAPEVVAVKRNSEAEHHLESVRDLRARASIVARRPIGELKFEFARQPAADDASEPKHDHEDALIAATQALEAIARLSAKLDRAIQRFEDRFSLAASTGGTRNKEPLLHHFVQLCAESWTFWTGQPAPISKGGPFVRFMGAAWRSLEFPELTDAETVLGGINVNR